MEINNLLAGFAGFYSVNNSTEQENMLVVKTDVAHFTDIVNEMVNSGLRLALLFGTDERFSATDESQKCFGVHAVLAVDDSNEWVMVNVALDAKDPRYTSLTKTIIGAVWYEKYMHDMFGITPDEHPDMRRLVHHENVPNEVYPLRKDFAWNTVMKKANEPYPMIHVEGNGVYEIPVGPIHAGIIEPGHFRFNVAGERIVNLEGKLFFTHKGVEKLLEGKSVNDALPFVERVSDDASVAHVLAFCQAVERICGCKISERADLIRVLFSELERMTMHIHDLSNIAGMGTGYTVMAANGFRIKEKLVRLSEKLVGNRFFKGMVIPGGVKSDLNKSALEHVIAVVNDVMAEMRDLLAIGLNSDGLAERMITTGVLSQEAAKAYCALGIASRGTDWAIDSRKDHPYSAYSKLNFKVITKTGGDVYARYMVRVGHVDSNFDD